MYHSITFWTSGSSVNLIGNTYNDFCLVPETIPVIAPPATKRQTVDIPGGNGVLDFTESLTKYPVYNERQGSVRFHVLNDRTRLGDITWSELYSRILNKIQGRLILATLDDIPDWYYRGRWDVSEWAPSNTGEWPRIAFSYNLEPYKLSSQKKTLTYSLTSTSSLTKLATLVANDIGEGPVVMPTITTTSGDTTIKITDTYTGYSYERTFTNAGTYNDPAIVLYDVSGRGIHLYGKGSGTVTFKFNERSL